MGNLESASESVCCASSGVISSELGFSSWVVSFGVISSVGCDGRGGALAFGAFVGGFTVG